MKKIVLKTLVGLFIGSMLLSSCSESTDIIGRENVKENSLEHQEIAKTYNAITGDEITLTTRNEYNYSLKEYIDLTEGVLNYEFGNASFTSSKEQLLIDTIELSQKEQYGINDVKTAREDVILGFKNLKNELNISPDAIKFIDLELLKFDNALYLKFAALVLEEGINTRDIAIPQFNNNENLKGKYGSCDGTPVSMATYDLIEEKVNQYFNAINTIPAGGYFYNISTATYFTNNNNDLFGGMWDFICPDEDDFENIDECDCNSPSYLDYCECSLFFDNFIPFAPETWFNNLNENGLNEFCLDENELNANVSICVSDAIQWANMQNKTPISVDLDYGFPACGSANFAWMVIPSRGNLHTGGISGGGLFQ